MNMYARLMTFARRRMLALMTQAFAVALALAGCAAEHRVENNTGLLSPEGARVAIAGMHAEPILPQRPILVLGGIHDPGVAAPLVARRLRALTHPDAVIIPVSFFDSFTFDACRDRVIAAVHDALGENPQSPGETMDVDVVAFSMGGLVARHAARPRPAEDVGARLRIARLFTVGTPHQGTHLAALPTLDRRAIDMRAGSAFLAALDADLHGAEYECVAYVRSGDAIVGEANAAPRGGDAHVLPNLPLQPAHLMMHTDPRIIADIARRLRGEEPLLAGPHTHTSPEN
jgi:hypothetical protein